MTKNVLVDIDIKATHDLHCNPRKPCQEVIPWRDSNFWKDLPNPTTCVQQKPTCINTFFNNNSAELLKAIGLHYPFSHKADQGERENRPKLLQPKQIDLQLTRRFFERWKAFARNRRNLKIKIDSQIEQKQKLDNFFKKLKRLQSQQLKQAKVSDGAKERRSKTAESGCYRHRFQAQQDIIRLQKLKLLKQERVIQELQLGKLSENIDQSLQETEKEIRETLAQCSAEVKSKRKIIQAESIEENLFKFHINSGKAPRLVQQMEKRALERQQRRQSILEKKRLIEQQKKRQIEMEIERKRALDEEEKKEHLREIKEERRRQMEVQQQIQLRKQRLLENYAKADKLWRRKLLELGFEGFVKLIIRKRENFIVSTNIYKISLIRKAWGAWIKYLTELDRLRGSKAELLYEHKMKTRILKAWIAVRLVSIQHLQVAEDLYEMRLQSKMFIHWHRYTCIQYVRRHRNRLKAENHYDKKILLHYFYQWKLLPTVIQLEKAKEEKKQRWREKVWEVVPDYTPVTEE